MHTNPLLLASTVAPAPPAGVASPVAPAGQSAAPAIPDISFSWGSYFEALAIICFILAVLWALLWFLKRRGSGGIFASTAPAMRIENRLALGPKKWLYIVRCLDKRLVLGISDKNISLISEWALEEEELQAPAKKGIFARKETGAKTRAKASGEAAPPQHPAEDPSFAAFLNDNNDGGRL